MEVKISKQCKQVMYIATFFASLWILTLSLWYTSTIGEF